MIMFFYDNPRIELIINFKKSAYEFFFTFTEKMYCLTLYYHMYGSTIGELIIATQNGTQTPVTHWSMTGDQGNVWHRLPGVSLSLDPHTKARPN